MRSFQKLFFITMIAVALHLSLQTPTNAYPGPTCPPNKILCSCPDGSWMCVNNETQYIFCGE